MKQDQLLNTLTFILFIGGATCLIVVFSQFFNLDLSGIKQSFITNASCAKEQSIAGYNDSHMKKIIPLQSTVKVFMNYYDCNEVKKGDLALFKYSASVEPVIRRVVAIPGDRFSLVARESGVWDLKINNQYFPNTENPYWIKSTSTPPLKAYIDAGRATLKKGEYLVLSAESPGLNDSGNYGIVKIDQLVGIAVYDY